MHSFSNNSTALHQLFLTETHLFVVQIIFIVSALFVILLAMYIVANESDILHI